MGDEYKKLGGVLRRVVGRELSTMNVVMYPRTKALDFMVLIIMIYYIFY
jgi:hypothetical protein